jgi:PAS domain S-box-containing protein
MTTRGEHLVAERADLAVARILASSHLDESLYLRLLAAIGESLEWDFGAWWEVSDGDQTLRCVETWRSASLHNDAFGFLTKESQFARGAGLPGRVCETGEPAWIADLGSDTDFPRAVGAARTGLRSGFAFPLSSGRGALGAIEMFTSRVTQSDEELLQTMASMGSQLGQLIERGRAEREVHESNERRRAILAAALDCVITIDERGRVVEFNHAAERTFGYVSDEAVGREMADLIVPPSLRERHREGLGRLLEAGEPQMLDRRIELIGMRADGSEFPVELAVTRIDLPGPPMFTGYLRDITDRKRVLSELQASRARIVDAADEARRRLEKDLHDGAQARLVNLGLVLRLARSKLQHPEEVGPLLDAAIDELGLATSELREFARGVHPAVLTDGGLKPALRALVERSHMSVQLGQLPSARLPPRVEATVYFLVAEALTNAARHSGAEHVVVDISTDQQQVTVEVRDDGRGGADVAAGSGLRGLADRTTALEGSLEVVSPAGKGTTIRARVPCE